MTANNINENQGTEQKENLSISPDVVKLLDSIGITTNEATLKNLEESLSKNRSLFESFKEDGDIVKQNPSEKSRFELLYLKGFGQMVTLKDGRVMSFAELFAEEQKTGKNVSEEIEDEDLSERYLEYSRNRKKEALNQEQKRLEQDQKALNQTAEKRTEVGQALNQKSERLNIVISEAKKLMNDEGLQFLSDELQKIQSSPESSPVVQDLIKQGAKMEDIQSGKYNGIIESRIIIDNEDIFVDKYLKDKTEVGKEGFHTLVNRMRDSLGVPPTPENIDRFLGSKVLGEGREVVGTAMHEIGKTGNYDRMIWDEDTRAIIFQGKNGEQVRIDTVSIPPRLTRSQDPLSISHDAEILNQEERKQREQRESALKLGEKGSLAYNEGIAAYIQSRTNEYRLPAETQEIFSRENGELQRDYERMEQSLMIEQDPAKRMEQIREMSRINESMKQENLENMLETSEGERHIEIDKMLEGRKENLRKIEQASALIQEANASLAKLSGAMSENRYEKFYRVSGFNLSAMRGIDLHKIGPRAQEIIDRIIAEINRTRDSQNQIKLDKKILDDSDRTTLKKSLEKLGGTKDILTSERIGTFQKNLNTMLAKTLGAPGSIEEKLRESPFSSAS